ncbi:MAG: DapH/DapD/GlmU-related protein [Pseudomonadota bacterium]
MNQDGLLRLIKQDLSRLSEQTSFEKMSVQYWKVFHPRFIPVLIIRVANACHTYALLRPVAFLFTWVNIIVFGIEVTPRCSIGGGLFLPHTSGTVIGAAKIGVNATIFQGVTIGAKYADMHFTLASRPIIEDDVLIGAGAKVLGDIRIGSKATIAANSLVLISLPYGATAIGVPAVIVGKHE